jgi:4'-phosphopantetheinyl transferase
MAVAPLAWTQPAAWERLPLRGPLPRLGSSAIHLWLASLDEPPCVVTSLDAVLSEEEQRRANRFLRPQDGRHYRVGRGLLRQLLGAYLGVGAASLRFAYGRAGKPRLQDDSESSAWTFNLSHSGGWVLIGITRLGQIGVDLEAIRPIPDHADLARQTFAPGEVAALSDLPPADRLPGFFRCWTRKEAVVKALGAGVSMPFDRFEVSITRNEPRLVSINGADARTFRLWSFDPLPSFSAALALYGEQTSPVHIATYRACPH